MNEKAGRAPDLLGHILAAIERIESYLDGVDLTAFEQNTLIQDAVIRNFEVIGEAANKIQLADPAFAKRHPHLQLDLAYRMRNALIHGYDAINLTTLWNTVHGNLPLLKSQIKDMTTS